MFLKCLVSIILSNENCFLDNGLVYIDQCKVEGKERHHNIYCVLRQNRRLLHHFHHHYQLYGCERCPFHTIENTIDNSNNNNAHDNTL